MVVEISRAEAKLISFLVKENRSRICSKPASSKGEAQWKEISLKGHSVLIDKMDDIIVS